MSIFNITLKDYDNVVAVTQIAVNQTMGEYLQFHPKEIAIYAKDDGRGNLIIVSSDAEASYILTGTLALEKDASGNWIELVNLKTDKGNQTVKYNVTIQNGEFKAPDYSIDIKQNGSTPWIFSFFVNLAMQDISKNELPDDIKHQMEKVDENIFSIQQLYVDLNTAALDAISGVEMPSLIKSTVAAMMKAYLEQQQKQGKPLFGVSVKYKDKNTLPPTLTPTYVNFCVTPYHDNSGQNTNPSLDTLNYLVMTNNNQPPAYPPESFSFNWIEDVNIHGTMAIRRKPFADFIVQQLNPILKTICPVMYCKADGHKSPPNDVVIQLNPGSDHTFNRTDNPTSGLIASYSYNTHHSNTDTGPFYAYYRFTVSGNYSSNINVYLKNNKITLSGSIAASGSTSCSYNSGGSSEVDMPNTTYNWSVDLQLYIDTANNGQLDLKVGNANFSSDPIVENHDTSWWEKFLESLSGFMQSYTNDLGDLREQIQGSIEGTIAKDLKKVLNTANHFVFPGAKTFSFMNPAFSDSGDLVSNITYLNPDA